MASIAPPTTRAARARQTRRRMHESARKLFVSQGYSDTTMTQIAEDAGVAVQTLYYTFQTKGKLLIEIVEVASAGGDPVPVPQREWFREMMSSTDAQRILALGVEHGTGIYERVAALWPAFAVAVSDPFVADYWESIAARRRDAQRGQVVRVSEVGNLKPGLTIEQATDLLFLLAGHAPYRSLVEDAGWPIVEYKSWLFRTLVQQILDTSIDPSAVADLSFAMMR